MADNEMHSTGRGGTGNIGKGEGQYADAAALTDGNPASKPGAQEHSTGRGGTGNIVHDSGEVVKSGAAPTEDGAQYTDYHTGRGGEGNVHRDKYGGHSKPPKQHGEGHGHGLVEKAKHAVGLDKK